MPKTKPVSETSDWEDGSVNDSEAETEILSTRNTPSKRRRLSSPTTEEKRSLQNERPRRETILRNNKSGAPHLPPIHTKTELPVNSHSHTHSNSAVLPPSQRNQSSVPPRPRSESPKNQHKRSSSYQSALQSQARRLRSRQSRESPDQRANDHKHSSEKSSHHSPHPDTMPAKNAYGRTQLLQACFRDDEDHVRQLLAEHPGDLERGDNAEVRPLQAAALEGRTGIVKLLLDAGADPNIWNSDGDTPLIEAITNDHVEIVHMLLEAGANPWRKNGLYQMPKDLTEEMPDNMKKQLQKALLKAADARIRQKGAADHLPLKPVPEKSVLYEGFSVQVLEKYCRLGIKKEVQYQLSTRVKPDLTCVVAAAMGGHVEILKLLQREGVDMDPEPTDEESTPMLAAIGRGNLDVVTYLIELEEFNTKRSFKGKNYRQIAFARKGPEMEREMRILEEAEGLAQASTGMTAEVSELGLATVPAEDKLEKLSLGATPQSGEKRKRLRTKAEIEEEQHQKEEARRDEEAKEHAKRYLREAEIRRVERCAYLDSLPHAISRALSAGRHVPASINDPEERRWKKTLKNPWLPIQVVKRSEIEADCSSEVAPQLYVHNLFPAIHLHHETLTRSKELGFNTLPMTREQHQKYFAGTWGSSDVAWDANWWEGPSWARDYAQATYGWELEEYVMVGSTTGKTAWRIKNRAAHEIEARQRMMELADGQFYWVELKQFIEHTAACAWLKDFDYRTDADVHFVPREQRTPTPRIRWTNGQIRS